MYECFHCLCKTVGWCSDFDYEDFDYEGEGIVHVCHCYNCGADIEYRVPMSPVEGEEADFDLLEKETAESIKRRINALENKLKELEEGTNDSNS